MNRMKKGIYTTLIFSVIVILVFVYISDPAKFFQVIKNGDPLFLGAGLIVLNLPLFIYAFTWWKIFEASGINLSYTNTFRVLLANTFINNITPFGNIGGEAAATYFISKLSGHEPGKIFSAVFISSLVNFSPLLSMLVVGLALNSYFIYLGALTSLMILSFLLFYSVRIQKNVFESGFLEKLPEKVRGFIQDFRSSFGSIELSGTRVLVLLSGSHLASVLDVLGIVLIGYSFGVDLFHPLIFLCVPLGRLANYFPTPGGTGSYEAAFTGLLVFFFGLTVAESVSISLTYRFLTYYAGLILGYFSAVSLGFSHSIFQEGEGMK